MATAQTTEEIIQQMGTLKLDSLERLEDFKLLNAESENFYHEIWEQGEYDFGGIGVAPGDVVVDCGATARKRVGGLFVTNKVCHTALDRLVLYSTVTVCPPGFSTSKLKFSGE